MKTEVLNIRVDLDDTRQLKQAAARVGVSANVLAAKMVSAAVHALAGYEGPILPLTLEFPHKITSQTKAK